MANGKWITDLTPDMPPAEAARVVLRVRLQPVSDQLPRAALEADKDIEHVHQLRVATRRADAALRIFRSCLPGKTRRKARGHLREVRRAAGAARDWDVFLAELSERSGKATARQQAGVDHLLGYGLAQRSVAQEQLRLTHLEEAERLEKLQGEVLADLHAPEKDGAPATLAGLARPLVEELLQNLTRAAEADLEDYAQLHQVRIAGKRLRYATEVFASCFEPDFLKDVYPRIEKLQEILGRANDSHVASERLTTLRGQIRWLGPAVWKRVQPGIEQLLRLHRRRLTEERRHFLDWWHHWQPEAAMLLLRLLLK
jgi:CHAD domain-containing protein